jgi:hypothetical protein
LREAGAAELHAVADLDLARGDLGDLDERRNAVPVAGSEAECRNHRDEEDEQSEDHARNADEHAQHETIDIEEVP